LTRRPKTPHGTRGDGIAEHGSWNCRRKIGYRITLVPRPADVLVAPDGSLLVSDDYAGAIYRIRYRGNGAGVQ